MWPVKFDIKYPNGKYDCEAQTLLYRDILGGHSSLSLSLYTYIHMYICIRICTCKYTWLCTYIERVFRVYLDPIALLTNLDPHSV